MAKDELEDLFKEVSAQIGELDDVETAQARKRVVETTSFPTEMHFSQVFDQLLKCYSIGGQMRHYYRYGEMSYCMEQRSKLWFWMGTRLKGDDQRKEAIAGYYKKRLVEHMVKGQSSEHVWASRQEPLRRPFRESFEAAVNDQ